MHVQAICVEMICNWCVHKPAGEETCLTCEARVLLLSRPQPINNASQQLPSCADGRVRASAALPLHRSDAPSER